MGWISIPAIEKLISAIRQEKRIEKLEADHKAEVATLKAECKERVAEVRADLERERLINEGLRAQLLKSGARPVQLKSRGRK